MASGPVEGGQAVIVSGDPPPSCGTVSHWHANERRVMPPLSIWRFCPFAANILIASGNVDRVGPSPIIPSAGLRQISPKYRATLLRGGLRGALFVHIASFVIPRRAMSRKVMSLRMTRLDTVVEGRA